MGQSGFSRVQIEFRDETPEEFQSAETLEKTLKDHHKGPCTVNIVDFEHHGPSTVTFEMYSDRLQNLEFQVNLVYDYLKAHFIPCEEMNASAYTGTDSGSAYYTAEDFDD